MKTYYVYKETFLFRLFKIIFLSKKTSIFYWDRNKGDADQYIPFPDISQCYSLWIESRSHLDTYYSDIMPQNTDSHLKSYFKKLISYTFSEYYCFRKAIISLKNKTCSNYVIVGPKYLSDIFEKEIGYNYFSNIFSFIYYTHYSLLKIIISIGQCLITRDKISVPDVFYYRKKILPHASEIVDLIKDRFSIETVTLQFSKNSNEYGIKYLNNFHNSFQAAIIAFIFMWKYFIHDIKYFFMLNIPGKMLYAYLINSFSTLCLVNMKPLIFFGIMEKPPFILLNKYKYEWQKTCVITDGFVYSPIPSLDYVYADVCYAMNNIEIQNINSNGGRIGKKILVGQFRNVKKTISKGVSKDLKKMIRASEHTVLVATNRLQEKNYFPITKEGLNQFLDVIIELAACNKESLFIIKTKKCESKSISPRINNALLRLDNVYIIHSDLPSLLDYNHFEDLIHLSDMLISMFFCSAVIWQALSIRIPVIACNYIHEHSFLRKFKNLEVRHDELKEAFYYWKNINNMDFEQFIADIDSETNVLKPNSFNVITENISNIAEESQYLHNRF